MRRGAEGREGAEECKLVLAIGVEEPERQDDVGRIDVRAGRSDLDARIAAELVVQAGELRIPGELSLTPNALKEMGAPLRQVERSWRHSPRVEGDPHPISGWLEQLRRDSGQQDLESVVAGE